MQLKLKKGGFEALEWLIDSGLEYKPESPEMKLVCYHMELLKDRISKRIDKMIDTSIEQKMKLKDQESWAFYIWYNNMRAVFDPNEYGYPIVIADRARNQIDQEII